MKHAHWFRVLVLLCQCLVCICSRLNMLASICLLRADASICKLPIGQKLFSPRWAPNHSLMSRRAMLAPSTREYLLIGLRDWLDAMSSCCRGTNSTRVQVWLLEVQQVHNLARWGRLFQCLLRVLIVRIGRSNLVVHKADLHLVRRLQLRLLTGESLVMTKVHIFVLGHSLAEPTDGLSITSRRRLVLHFLNITDGSVSFLQTFLISCHFFTRSLDHTLFLWIRFSWMLWRGETHGVSLASSCSPGVGAACKQLELAVNKLCGTHLNWLLRLQIVWCRIQSQPQGRRLRRRCLMSTNLARLLLLQHYDFLLVLFGWGGTGCTIRPSLWSKGHALKHLGLSFGSRLSYKFLERRRDAGLLLVSFMSRMPRGVGCALRRAQRIAYRVAFKFRFQIHTR